MVIEDVISEAGIPAGRVLTSELLTGGLSHQVILIGVDERRYVLRILDPAVSRVGLGIPPAQELENTVLASGIGPTVYFARDGLMLLEYIDGRTLTHDDVRDMAVIPRLAEACRELHAGPAFVNEFSIVAKAAELLDLCRRHALEIPSGYPEAMAVLRRIADTLPPVPHKPCHNDLLPANFMDDGRIRIIDYQLSGMNDPAFELGDIAAEADYDLPRIELLARSYYGSAFSEALLARVRLCVLASNVTWTLWFSVHHGLLYGDSFDYAAEAAAKWARAERDLSHPELGSLLQTPRKV